MICTGECCSTLYFPGTHDQIKQHADILIDGWQIINMIDPTGEQSSKGHHYTCKHWDQTTRLCTIYENRPFMCSDYPYGQACEHCGLEEGIPPSERLVIQRAGI